MAKTARIYGIAELAKTLHVESQVISTLVHRGKLPPATQLKVGSVWTGKAIEDWLKAARTAIAEANLAGSRISWPDGGGR